MMNNGFKIGIIFFISCFRLPGKRAITGLLDFDENKSVFSLLIISTKG